MLAGNGYDLDMFNVDSRGQAFVGLQDVDFTADIDDTGPHTQPSGTHV